MTDKEIKVFIEIPKGDDRRRHLSHDKKEMLDLGPISNVIPINKGVMPIAYGFIVGTLQKDESAKNPNEIPDEVDVLVYSRKVFKVGETITGTPIALIIREDGDHKVVAVDSTTCSKIKKWSDIPLQERNLILEYFGYTSPIIKINDSAEAVEYINKNKIHKTKV